METNIFSSLKDHVKDNNYSPQETNSHTEEQGPFNNLLRLSFIFFNEIKELSPLQSRVNNYDPEVCSKDKELLDSISAVGITTPIIVREQPDGKRARNLQLSQRQGERKYVLVSGHRRIAAGKAAGLNGVYGIILNPNDNHELITFAENQGRKELSTYETAFGLRTLKERKNLSDRQAAEAVGLSRTHANRLLNALKAPDSLRELWIKGRQTATALVNLKDHWEEISKASSNEITTIGLLSQNDVKILSDQLDTGIPLKNALDLTTAIASDPAPAITTPLPTGKSKQSREEETSTIKGSFKSSEKEAIIKAIRHVFPRPKLEKINALFDLAIATNEKEMDVIFAAALYVSRGGDVNEAIPDCKAALKKPGFRALMKREIKNMKQAAALYKTKKQDKNLKKTIRICFPGI